MKNTNYNVIIVGGGPSGLSLANLLNEAGITYLILEKGIAGSSWRSMPDKLQVLSPLWTNLLSGSSFPLFNSYNKPTAKEYAQYLFNYSNDNSLKIFENTKVTSIEKNDENKYTIHTDRKRCFNADIVVCATGYFNNPYIPNWEYGNDYSIPQIHSKDYKNAQQIKNKLGGKRNILIVGSRISAGQLITELYDEGFTIAVSHREKIKFRKKNLLMTIKEFIYFPYEEIKIRLSPDEKRNSADVMEGGKSESLLQEGKVKSYPTINKIHNDMVNFIDDRNVEFDLIIYATGYQPALSYIDKLSCTKGDNHIPLSKDFESTEIKNIFFLGFDNIKNFRSRYLRGIRSDSKELAVIIQTRLKHLLST